MGKWLKLQLSFYVKKDGAGNRVRTGDLDVGNAWVIYQRNEYPLSKTPNLRGLNQFSIILNWLLIGLGYGLGYGLFSILFLMIKSHAGD